MKFKIFLLYIIFSTITFASNDCDRFFESPQVIQNENIERGKADSETETEPSPVTYANDKFTKMSEEDLAIVLNKAKEEWPKIYQNIDKNWIETDLMYRRFFNPKDIQTNPDIFPLDLYRNSLKQYQSFKTASKFLYDIKKGEFNLNEELIINLHKIVMEGVYRVDEQFASKIVPALVAPPGEYKVFKNFGFSPLTKRRLNESEYNAIIENKNLKFIEVPFLSKPNNRLGLIQFPSGKTARIKLLELIDWYRLNKGKMDTIELAAKFQRQFISLHPFHNGNGRISRLLMDRILFEDGYPPAILVDHNMDIYISEEEWVRQVKMGVARSETLYGELNHIDAPIAIGAIQPGSTLVSNYAILPNGPESEVNIGKDTLVLFKDGFFYNNKGIPHVLQNKVFYPINDQAYLLYSQNGKLITEAKAELNKQSKRKNNRFAIKNFEDHIRFLKKYKNKEINLLEYKILPYETIAQSNQSADLFIYPWQKDLFLNAIKIDEYEALPILCRKSGSWSSSSFENKFHYGMNEQSIGHMLAHYQMMELKFYNYEKFAKAHFPEYLPQIYKSQEKLFSAGKAILRRFEENISALSPEEKTLFFKSPHYQLFNEYLQVTPLGFPSLNEAKNALGDQIYLLRSDMEIYSKTGFLPEGKMNELIKSLPFSDHFIAYLRKKLESEPENHSLSQFVKRVLGNPYRYKGIDETSTRKFIDMYNHAINREGKNFLSYSTSVDLYSNSMIQGNLPFSAVEGSEYLLYFVSANKKNVYDNFSSNFTGEYEILISRYTSPLQIKRKIKKDAYKLSNEESEQVAKIVGKVFTFNMNKISIE